MSSFAATTTTPASAPPDPSKHVNYTLGMVLGVDDFTQEFTYLSNRDQWLARDSIGYGTVCGLKVEVETDATQGPRVSVSPGVALSPAGQLIRVTREQCAALNDWLAAHRTELLSRLSSPPSETINLYVVLCYRTCPTDNVPIPGEPCRSEDEAMAPSRWTDDFKLELRFDPPEQREEDALRDFIAWLRQVEITPDSTTSLEDFIAAIKNAALLLASPPSSPPSSPPDFMHGSPPIALNIPAERACEFLSAALRIWATELRPIWLGTGQSCGTPPNEECLLLAELNVPLVQVALTGEWRVDDDRSVVQNEERRPYLVHLRMLQELVLCGLPSIAVQSLTSLAGFGFPSTPRGLAPHTTFAPDLHSRAETISPTARYRVIAAGTVKADGSTGPTVYNGLTAQARTGSEVLVKFGPSPQYQPPNDSFQYLIHALPKFSNETPTPIASFVRFEPEGLVLRVTNGTRPLSQAQLTNLELMIEVSRYE